MVFLPEMIRYNYSLNATIMTWEIMLMLICLFCQNIGRIWQWYHWWWDISGFWNDLYQSSISQKSSHHCCLLEQKLCAVFEALLFKHYLPQMAKISSYIYQAVVNLIFSFSLRHGKNKCMILYHHMWLKFNVLHIISKYAKSHHV